jgi:hypothetical protein
LRYKSVGTSHSPYALDYPFECGPWLI